MFENVPLKLVTDERGASAQKFESRVPRRGPRLRTRCLTARSFVDRNLQGVDFSGADLRDCDFRGADLFGTRFPRADLRGACFDMTRLVEIWVPRNLPIDIVNQIRHFDFRFVSTRWIGSNRRSEPLPCPYRHSSIRPFFYAWGSATWNMGRSWETPRNAWTSEEIIGAVLDAMGCRHDAARPFRVSARASS